ncbi:MAG TPA: RNA-binding S4 domain-containing protein [Pseudohaliea sp.]|nr:RNA-binding S4 domain-containing protein [Pseudohaliea sp.]
MSGSPLPRLRVDKWLWAARFFKTRSLAKAAIEGGKVQLDGQRVKVSKEIVPGDVLRIRQGWDDREITVLALSDQRRGAPEAQALYEESADSIARREAEAAARRAAGGMMPNPRRRPSKRERRQIHRFREDTDS